MAVSLAPERRPILTHATAGCELLGPVFVRVLPARHSLKVGQGVVHGVPVMMVNHHAGSDWPMGGGPNHHRALQPFSFRNLHIDATAAVPVDPYRLRTDGLFAPIGSPLLELRGRRKAKAFAAFHPRNMPRLEAAPGSANAVSVGKTETPSRTELTPRKMGRLGLKNRPAHRACLFHKASFDGFGTIPRLCAELEAS